MNGPSSSELHEYLPRVLFSLLPALYSGVHLSAWGFEFPSPVEGFLWKLSCFDIAITFVPAALVEFVLTKYHDPAETSGLLGNLFGMSLALLLGIAYSLSRLYIVIEAFISLRHVPIGVYSTVAWSQSIPHV
jgi:hypothetical protein